MASRGKKKRQQHHASVAERLRGPVASAIFDTPWRDGTQRGVVVGGTRYAKPGGPQQFCLDVLDLDSDDLNPRRVPLPFLAHGFSVDPRNVRRAVVFEKWGPGAALVDLVDRARVQTIAPKAGHHFYGHGCFSRDGSVVYAVETNLETFEGVLTIRDGTSFAILDEMPTFGRKPHDCMMIDEGRTLAITNARASSDKHEGGSVTFVCTTERRLLDERRVSNPRLNAGHMAMDRAGGFAVSSAARDGLDGVRDLGGVSLCSTENLTSVAEPAELVDRLLGEALSVCLHESTGRVFVTHPYANLVTVWGLGDKRLIRSFDVLSPRGVAVTLCGTQIVLSCEESASVRLLDPVDLSLGDPLGQRVFSGSHLFPWAYPAQE